jgi:glycosyltransferase involved in cell wall biosynthesis
MIDTIPKISLVMASFNRSELLDVSLTSIEQNLPDFPFEIVVVNDGLEDKTEAVCRKHKQLNIRYFFTGQRNKNGLVRRNPVFPNNFAIKQATGDIVILTNPEIYHLERALSELIPPLLSNKKYLVIPEVLYFDDLGTFTEQIKKGQTGNLRTLVNKEYHAVMPFLLACWKKEIIAIGGYDEDFIGYASDDNDFIDRLLKNGCSHFRVPAKVVHLKHEQRCPEGMLYSNPAWVYNRRLLISRADKIVRNKGKEWGTNNSNMEFNKTMQSIFTNIYVNKSWNSKETVSGTGSQLEATVHLREQLPKIFSRYDIKRVLDIGCGDCNWMKEIFNGFEFYLGVDLVSKMIENNVKNYGSEKIQFVCDEVQNLDIDSYNFDVVILTDVMVHLSFFDIEVVLNKLKQSNIKYIMMTNFREHREGNVDIQTGQWRPINWNIRPFQWKKPLESVSHHSSDKREAEFSDKHLDLWELSYKQKEIPKILHMYWDRSPMSELQTMTVTTFHEKNPDWEIRLYTPIQPYVIPEGKYVPDYTGKDYFYLLEKLDYVQFISIDVTKFNIDPNIHNILQSDIFRYQVLYEVGGVWSDFDVLWLKSMKYLSKIPVEGNVPVSKMGAFVTRWRKTKHNNIAILFAVPKHPFYKYLVDGTMEIQKANTNRNTLSHQVFGTDLLDKIYPSQQVVESLFIDVVNFPYKVFYPYSVYEMDKLFEKMDLTPIDNEVMGIHWFNGHEISKAYINSEEPDPNCSMTKIVSLIKKKIL